MRITEPMVLPDDVLIIPAAELSQHDRASARVADGEFAVTRRFARAPSKIVGSGPASLLGAFRSPQPIVEVVAAYANAHGLKAEEVLEKSYAFLKGCLRARILVPADSPLSERIVPILGPGDDVAGAEIVRCVKVLDDTEVYQARTRDGTVVAVKILRPECAEWTVEALERETATLARLDGVGAPRMVARGTFEGRAYVVLEWCAGVSPKVVADEIRSRADPRADRELLSLCASVLAAYAQLHERGVLHGDVHPGNVLVDHSGRIRLLDFGFSASLGAADGTPRGGSAHFLDPEHARAQRSGDRPPPPTPAAEQYSLAALLYLLVTGGHMRDFPADRGEALRQICEDPPLPFSARGVPAWPEVEEVLARALAKRPQDRWPSIGDFLASWTSVPERVAASPAGAAPEAGTDSAFCDRVLERLRVDGPLWKKGLGRAPRSSLAGGSAGIAYALYRIAGLRADPGLLADAGAWIARAEAETALDDAFHDEASLSVESIGAMSPFHTESGVHAVRVLIAQAECDAAAATVATRRFLHAIEGACVTDDLWLGRTGALLSCALLLPALAAAGVDGTELRGTGDRLADDLLTRIDTWGPVRDCADLPNYGIAHGWAGHLYALLRWRRVTGAPPETRIRRRLDELAACGEPSGRGVRFPWRDQLPRPGAVGHYSAGWCNGSAGHVFLWTLASDVYERKDDLERAHRAAWHAWESAPATPHLCCGTAGIAFALLHLYRHTGEIEWRRRGMTLVDRATANVAQLRAGPDARYAEAGLYRGEVGIALLTGEAAFAENAAMPFFADEGWPAIDGGATA